MVRIVWLVLFWAALAPLALGQTARPLAITHVTVIDATGAAPRLDMTVIIVGERITAIGPAMKLKIPPNAEVIDATGKFLIPGLHDMHVHLTMTPDPAVSRAVMAPLLVAYGVTSVRDMGGDWERLQQLRAAIGAGTIVGLRILTPGPFVDGPQPPGKAVLPVNDEAGARQAVRKLKTDGVDFIKVQAQLAPAVWQAVVAEAKQQRLTVAGHVPERVSAFAVATSGQRSLEHISPVLPGDAGLLLACSNQEEELRRTMLELGQLAQQPNPDRQQLFQRQRALQAQLISTYDNAKCGRLLALLAQRPIWVVPTQIFGRQFAPLHANDLPREAAWEQVPLSTRTRWETRRKVVIQASKPEDYAFRQAMFEQARNLVGALHRAGVKLLAGTDTLDGYVLPGLSLHQELEWMVAAGLTPLEALQTATRNPAQFLGKSTATGTIARGKDADLLLLEADPLVAIRNTQRIHTVILKGQVISPQRRQQLLDNAAAWASQH